LDLRRDERDEQNDTHNKRDGQTHEAGFLRLRGGRRGNSRFATTCPLAGKKKGFAPAIRPVILGSMQPPPCSLSLATPRFAGVDLAEAQRDPERGLTVSAWREGLQEGLQRPDTGGESCGEKGSENTPQSPFSAAFFTCSS
jgi:hypothetical protein